MSCHLQIVKIYNMEKELKLPEDFVQIIKEDINYKMPTNFKTEFIDDTEKGDLSMYYKEDDSNIEIVTTLHVPSGYFKQ